MMNFKGGDILSTSQFSLVDVETLFQVAQKMEPFARRKKVTRVLEGAVLGNLFFEPSTRSRISFGAAFNRLGGAVCDTTGFQFSSMAKGESVYDTSRVVSGYVDILVVRHPVEGIVREFADATNIPVINGGDGPGEHPTQALLDLYTVYRSLGMKMSAINKRKIALVGDLKYGRTVHSLVKLLALFQDMEFIFVAPDELQMPEVFKEKVKARGHSVRTVSDIHAGLPGADIIYTTRIQQERFTDPEDAEKYRGSYSINREFFEKYCNPKAILMHPLPRDSRTGHSELDDDLNTNRNLAIFQQTDNGIPIRMALFALILGVEDQVHLSERDANWYVPEHIGIHEQ
jgi:aspartate carbamoyltransferase catalytic subunit